MPRVLYASFDEVPAPKGASTHILAVVQALGARFGELLLVTPGRAEGWVDSLAPGVRQEIIACPDDNPIGRARTFQTQLARVARRESWDVIHFRSPWEGLALLDPPVRRQARLVYEVNGFPSIELKYHYRSLVDDDYLTEKLRQQELACLQAADRIVTVSAVNAAEIVARGVDPQRITILPNGVDPDRFAYQPARPLAADEPLRVAYVGTLAIWQGVDTLIEAAALAIRDRPVELEILGVGSRQRTLELQRLCGRLEIESQTVFRPGGSQAEVVELLHRAHVAAVPLLAVDRNVQQGCCPLKLLEAMAAGTPVVASDLAVVRELAQPDEHFLAARAGDARNLKNGLLRLAGDDALRQRLSQAARQHVVGRLTWRHSLARLIRLYEEILAPDGLKMPTSP